VARAAGLDQDAAVALPRPALRRTLLLALAAGCLAARGALAAPPGCASAECHGPLLRGRSVHEVAGDCESCHEPVADRHPVPGERTFRLTQLPPALCADCHETGASHSTVHPPFGRGTCTICHAPHAAPEPRLVRRPIAALCRTCHADPAALPAPHGPVAAGDCLACHAPHESDPAQLLRKPADTLCFDCHAEVRDELGKRAVHGALENGCTSCHAPHGAARPKLLAAPVAALCGDCHAEVTEALASARVVHPPAVEEGGCVACHAPHAADHAQLLARPTGELCLSCHRDAVPAAPAFQHAPVGDGDCTACHDPHAGARAGLLARAFPDGRYAPYEERTYALCFDCHDAALARFPDTSFATGFRDGDRNLHFVHVNAKKGRSCALCHAVHGAPNPALLATAVRFGAWELPLGFRKTATGGSCAPGCHQKEAYDREQPAGNDAGEEPGAEGAL
jgi:predicted CXXCH cytochrome family protein